MLLLISLGCSDLFHIFDMTIDYRTILSDIVRDFSIHNLFKCSYRSSFAFLVIEEVLISTGELGHDIRSDSVRSVSFQSHGLLW